MALNRVAMSHSPTSAFSLPAEHGAWGILMVPFVCAAAVAANWGAPLLLCGLCGLTLFVLNGALEADLRRFGAKRRIAAAHVVLLAAAVVSGGLLVFAYGRYELLAVGAAALFLFLLRRWLIAQHDRRSAEKRSLWAELTGAALLTLSAPAAWIASLGSIYSRPPGATWALSTGFSLWLLNLAFFLGGILCVKYRVRSLLAHREFHSNGERLLFAWPVFAYHALLGMLLAGWFVREWFLPAGRAGILRVALLGLAFTPGLLRAGRLFFQIRRRFVIRRVGWSEVFHSLVFAALLIFALRWAA